ncbi:MAG: diguanylate cyclase [Desulfuromonadales bacterium C00003094]|jgi:diguanylate cyclase (GGDEF)-like protein/PAS domain S-box-containing protein|nr:MAG: diguanylate cyclase [Desulfuromonadales bacterium C00003094]OEU77461.1 MAG: diguanylate cyclase [Desulfuromonadales bacterium C00003107]
MIFNQISDMINMGLVVLDEDLKVHFWNRWMALHSGIDSEEIVGQSLFDFFPNLNEPKFLRNCRAVFTFGNFAFFSQKLHRYLFPFRPAYSDKARFDYMQQSCTMGPIRDEDKSVRYIFLSVNDVTEVVNYEEQLIEMNQKDALTGIYNRRFFGQKLQEEFVRSRRHNRPLSLIMIDIDHFKQVNDNHGHQVGDEALKAFSARVKDRIRKTDILARYGGEEFACLLPETSGSSALRLAEVLRRIVAEENWVCRDVSLRMTISIGIAEGHPEIADGEALLKKADDALYEAKAGRNRAILYD